MSGTTQKRRNPARWLFDEYPKRYFGTMVGRETRDNIEGVKQIYRTVPSTIRHFKNLPNGYRKARLKFEEEFIVDGRTEKERHYQNKRSGWIQIATLIAIFFFPFDLFTDSIVALLRMDGSIIIAFNSFSDKLSVIVKLCIMWVGILYYMAFSYHSFALRNRITLNPFKFVELAIKHPSILLPMQGLDSTMESKFGDKWYTAIYKE